MQAMMPPRHPSIAGSRLPLSKAHPAGADPHLIGTCASRRLATSRAGARGSRRVRRGPRSFTAVAWRGASIRPVSGHARRARPRPSPFGRRPRKRGRDAEIDNVSSGDRAAAVPVADDQLLLIGQDAQAATPEQGPCRRRQRPNRDEGAGCYSDADARDGPESHECQIAAQEHLPGAPYRRGTHLKAGSGWRGSILHEHDHTDRVSKPSLLPRRSRVNGHQDLRVGGHEISRSADIRNPGGRTADLRVRA